MLETLVSSRIRRALLEYLLVHPDSRFYLRGLAKELGLTISPLRRELKRLEQAGVLKAYEEANVRFYVVDQTAPLFVQLKRTTLSGSQGESAVVPASPRPLTTAQEVEELEPSPPLPQALPGVRISSWRWPHHLFGFAFREPPHYGSPSASEQVVGWQVVAALSLTLVIVVVLGTVTYLAITNQQLLVLTTKAVSTPKTQVTVVETDTQSRATGEMRSSKWRLLPGGTGGFAVSGTEETY